MKQKAPASYSRSAAVAALMICFCVPVIGQAQIINLPAAARQGEDFRLLLRIPPARPIQPKWDGPDREMNCAIAQADSIALDDSMPAAIDSPGDRRAEEQHPTLSAPESLPSSDGA